MFKGFLRSGDPFIWMTGGTLAFSLLMIAALIWIVGANALGFFWPDQLRAVDLQDGNKLLGAVRAQEAIPQQTGDVREYYRTQFQVANRDLYGSDFRWVDDSLMTGHAFPEQVIYLERYEWGPFFGFLTTVRQDGEIVAEGFDQAWPKFLELHARTQATLDDIHAIEKKDIGDINYDLEQLRIEVKRTQRRETDPTRAAEKVVALEQEIASWQQVYEEKAQELAALYQENSRYHITVQDINGKEKELAIAGVVRGFLPNNMNWLERLGLYVTRFWEFFWEDPREANTEGGVFPAIFGTVMMVIIMSIVVVPFGVVAALYLREYAKQGPLVRAVRIAVNNLAGVPSIVFGVFGLGFFVYVIGGSLDQLFYQDSLPTPTYGTGGILWASLTLALLTVPVVIVATEESLSAIPREWREGSLALGATKWETLRKIVIPGALPGILTGTILAMARGAGEVAPLMITGVVKLAPTLPVDGHWPFFHLERKFMHLGFHIYDVGFQSPNVEAAKPMVFMTTLLLIVIVIALNLAAIAIRNRLRSRLRFGAF
ncbi:MAG: phosphate ABC transporter permease PstA [Desulfurellaceae bacterium]|nr:phosphate ABC transporter permease PstA [Desulfurellaceae bacterium]